MYGLARMVKAEACRRVYPHSRPDDIYLRRRNTPTVAPMSRLYHEMIDRIESLMAHGRHFISLKDITGDFS